MSWISSSRKHHVQHYKVQSTGLFVYLCVSLSDCLCSSLSVLSSFCLLVFLFVCLCVCLSVCLTSSGRQVGLEVEIQSKENKNDCSVCLSVCLSVY